MANGWRWDEWSDQHALAVVWAFYLGGIAAWLTVDPARAAGAAAAMILVMIVATGWLVRWWQGAVITAGGSVFLAFIGAANIELDVGVMVLPEAVGLYLVGLVFLGMGRAMRRGWHHWRENGVLAQHLAAAHEREAFQAQFFSMAAHEIGTPLTPLKLQVQALLMRPEAAPLETGLLRIRRNVDRLERLSKDLLDASRIHAGTMQLDPQPSRVDAMLADVVAACRAAAEEGEVDVSLQADAIEAVVDAHRLGQVVWNLTSNALKFTPPGGHITLRAWTDQYLRIRVEDDGMGMKQEQIDSLFAPFTQFHRERVRGGTGLGLFVSQGICQAHGGAISATSAGPGQGSAFEITIPLVRARAPVPEAPAEEPVKA